MRKIIPLTGLILLLITSIYGQDVDFKYITEKDNTKEIVFAIIGINDDTHAKQVENAFLLHDQVISCKIFYNKRCKLLVDASVDTENADKAREILQNNGVDFDIDYVEALNKPTYIQLFTLKEANPDKYTPNPIPSNQWVYPENLLQELNDLKEAGDKVKLSNAKQNWIENNPEAYKKMSGVEYLDYSLELNKK